jgi:CYTH domain-containing protein
MFAGIRAEPPNRYKECKQMASERIGKYACLESERRYLLKEIPDDLFQGQGWRITDQYFPATRLRLRRMKSITGEETIYKLTQKYRTEAQSAYETTITNLYLTEAEYNFLRPLEAKLIEKRRYPYRMQNHHFSIDVFEGRHQGLILAEMEFEKTESAGLAVPVFALADVTDDPFFTGGNLVHITEAQFRQGLSQRLREHENL